jgi:exonuclease SbcD
VRFIHTADWHLGRLLHGLHLTEDQSHVLDQLIALVREAKPHALIVAGDIYDRAVPPPEAVELLDHVLSEVVLGAGVPVILIAGNHDSPERLGFASRILTSRGLHVFGVPADPCGHVALRDEHGPVHVYALPYADPPRVRECLREEGLATHQDATTASVRRIRGVHPAGERSVLVGHAFVAGGEGSESEREISVGGADRVDATTFNGFEYVALGHLHRPQSMAEGRVRYSGSLLKYSFSEAGHTKGVHLVEMGADRACRLEDVPLTPRRDVRRIRGRFEELLGTPRGNRDDYVLVELEDEGPVLDAVARLRAVYPNLLHLERLALARGADAPHARPDHRGVDDQELFARFFLDMTEVEITQPQRTAFTGVLERMHANPEIPA